MAVRGAHVNKTDGQKVFDWRPRTGRHSVGRASTRWSRNLVRVNGIRWLRMVQNLGVAYVHCWK